MTLSAGCDYSRNHKILYLLCFADTSVEKYEIEAIDESTAEEGYASFLVDARG